MSSFGAISSFHLSAALVAKQRVQLALGYLLRLVTELRISDTLKCF
jgi:hypothetical protein